MLHMKHCSLSYQLQNSDGLKIRGYVRHMNLKQKISTETYNKILKWNVINPNESNTTLQHTATPLIPLELNTTLYTLDNLILVHLMLVIIMEVQVDGKNQFLHH